MKTTMLFIEPIARIGLLSRGALYVLVGGLAVLAALGSGGKTTDPRGAVDEVGRFSAAKPLLFMLALGLTAFAIWRAAQAIEDLDHKGRSLPALATRLGYLISGLLHLGLAATTAGFAVTGRGGWVRSGVARALIEPLGGYAVGFVGAIVIGVGLEQFYRVWSMSFERDLEMSSMSPTLKTWVGLIGRFGFGARGITFLIVGWFFIRAARNLSAREVKDMGEALKVIGAQWHGDLLLGIVAAGTMAYGLMTFIEARYRRIVRSSVTRRRVDFPKTRGHHGAMISKSYGEHRAQTATPTVTLTERPEQALFHLVVAVETESAAASLPLLKRSVTRLDELLPPLGAKLTVTDFDLPSALGKSTELISQLHATLTVPFPKEASLWDRAQKLAQVDGLLRALVLEGKKQKPSLEVRFDLPVFVVADPELRRAALITRLHERARSLGHDVILTELRFDRPVEQRGVSLEEVQLSLAVEGVAEVALR